MKPTVLPLTMSKIVGQIRCFNLDMATSLGEGKQFNPVKLCLKLILCHILLMQWLGEYIYTQNDRDI